MTTYGLLMCLPVVGLLVVAAVTDIRSRRIPNWLTFAMLLSGIAQSFTPAGMVSPGASMLGFAVGFALPFVLFAMGALGGGDVKLLAALGAWFGPQAALNLFVIAAVAGAVMVLIQAGIQGRTKMLLRNSAMVAINVVHVNEVGLEHTKQTGQSSKSIDRPLPYAVPVLIAMSILLVSSWTPGS